MNLELRHYRYFAALAEELHFGRAAERLGISQPALSQQFRWIEQEAGAPLLSRSKRRIALTDVGAVFYEEAMGVLRQVQHAGLVTASASRGDVGCAAIGYVASAALSGLLPRLVYRFRQDHPAVRLAMREMDMPAQLEAVARGELDIGFIRPPLRSLPEGLALFGIASEAVVAALHATHALAGRARVDVAMLRDETFICTHTEHGTGFYAITLAICGNAGFQPRVEALSTQMATIISMVAAGFGVALIPASMRAFAPPDVVFKPLARNDVASQLAVVHRKNERSPTVLRLIERCREAKGAGRQPESIVR
ncbi:LysR substrate-binding domain-containing protein [Cupriavidus basilensis]|uniref:LysR substrate-binding domain-containing protein n=1 Tax=Cupriavidus basilensis TaxID=68895 RepID=UPI00284DE40E|nr:LysR substrate-binding domain-containing protein [Cupriavidus basilensis]MDR3385082.1 LysR substrate-binding domain-containing protein [Cupriavidus basilensis]